MALALKRSEVEYGRGSCADSIASLPVLRLCRSDCPVFFLQQARHFLSCLAFANPAVVLNPEAGRFGNDLVVRRKSDAGANPVGFVCSSNQNAAVQNIDDPEKWSIDGKKSAGKFRKKLELFQRYVEHRPSSIKQMQKFASDYFSWNVYGMATELLN